MSDLVSFLTQSIYLRSLHTYETMSSNTPPSEEGSRRAGAPAAPAPVTNGNASQQKGGLVPTNNVTTKDGLTVRARIEPTLTVEDVIRKLCINLKIKDPPAVYGLRDETDELVTDDNLWKKIKGKVNLK